MANEAARNHVAVGRTWWSHEYLELVLTRPRSRPIALALQPMAGSPRATPAAEGAEARQGVPREGTTGRQ